MNTFVETIAADNGYTVEVHYDSDPLKPDYGVCPMIILSYHMGRGYLNEGGGEDVLSGPPIELYKLTHAGRLELLEILGRDFDIGEDRDDFDQVLEITIETLDERGYIFDRPGARERLLMLEALYRFHGWPVNRSIHHGACQGDTLEILCVATPDWCSKIGHSMDHFATTEGLQDLETQAEEYANWAFGEVYGFVIKDPSGVGIDSCWGYCGDDHEKSGLIESATWSLKHVVEVAELEAAEVSYWASRDVVTL